MHSKGGAKVKTRRLVGFLVSDCPSLGIQQALCRQGWDGQGSQALPLPLRTYGLTCSASHCDVMTSAYITYLNIVLQTKTTER